MTDKYLVYDHDLHGHATPDVEPGRVFFDGARVVCSEHGDVCATDGSLLRASHVAEQVGVTAEGFAIFDHQNAPKIGDSRLFKCTVCGQGTWSDGTVVPDPTPL